MISEPKSIFFIGFEIIFWFETKLQLIEPNLVYWKSIITCTGIPVYSFFRISKKLYTGIYWYMLVYEFHESLYWYILVYTILQYMTVYISIWRYMTVYSSIWRYIRQASFIKPLMTEQRRHVSCVGDGGNWTHAIQVRMWLDPAFAFNHSAKGAVTVYQSIWRHKLLPQSTY